MTQVACSHVEYSRGQWKADMRNKEYLESKRGDIEGLEMDTQEVVLLDRTGGLCAELSSGLNQASARNSAIREAVKNGKRTAEYSWREHSPAEYRGLDCGIHYKWGQGRGFRTYNLTSAEALLPTSLDNTGKTSMWETGLHLGMKDIIIDELPWLYYTFATRFSVGDYEMEEISSFYDADIFLHWPLHWGISAYPTWLYGFGIEGFGGADPISWLFTEDAEKFYNQLDFGGRAAYYLTLDAVAFGVFAGWERRHGYWGDLWVKSEEFKVGGTFSIFWENVF